MVCLSRSLRTRLSGQLGTRLVGTIQHATQTWPPEQLVRIAGLHTFDIGGNRHGKSVTCPFRLRVRHPPENNELSGYGRQMNLNEALDHAIAIVPEDAYYPILLFDHDLCEDDEGKFCYRRAYSDSRICTMASAVLTAWAGRMAWSES